MTFNPKEIAIMPNNPADRPSQGQPTSCDIMVRNGYVVTMDGSRRIFAPGAVAIIGRRIAAAIPHR